ncbi:hypothetical protein BJI47_07905 [Rhodococcus sp. 1168]|nr:hypothetical protein BJI47_07905 [Rhodococcus sp. 1168]
MRPPSAELSTTVRSKAGLHSATSALGIDSPTRRWRIRPPQGDEGGAVVVRNGVPRTGPCILCYVEFSQLKGPRAGVQRG